MMQHGSLQLQSWLTRRGYTQREVARLWGLHWTTINKIVAGLRLPGRQTAIDIKAETGIPIEAWTALPVDKKRGNDKPKAKNGNVDRVPLHV